jgi:hypothetical protein
MLRNPHCLDNRLIDGGNNIIIIIIIIMRRSRFRIDTYSNQIRHVTAHLRAMPLYKFPRMQCSYVRLMCGWSRPESCQRQKSQFCPRFERPVHGPGMSPGSLFTQLPVGGTGEGSQQIGYDRSLIQLDSSPPKYQPASYVTANIP